MNAFDVIGPIMGVVCFLFVVSTVLFYDNGYPNLPDWWPWKGRK